MDHPARQGPQLPNKLAMRLKEVRSVFTTTCGEDWQMAAEITVSVSYTDAPAGAKASPAVRTDTSGGPFPPCELTGEGDRFGPRTHKKEPKAGGGFTVNDQQTAQPGTFVSATVTISYDCPEADPPKQIKLTATGNVSAFAKVDGNCLTAKAVNYEKNAATGVETITETTQHVCC